MQVCTITQAVRLRKIHGRVAKRAPWMRIAAVHGGGIQTKDAVDCEHYIIETYFIDELAARHTDIAVARALAMVACKTVVNRG